MATPFDWIGYLAGICVMVSLVPQVLKSWKTKSTKDISLTRYAGYTVGLALWVTFAILTQNDPLALMNGLELCLALVVLALKLKHG